MQIKNHTEKKIFIDDYKPAFPYVNWQCCQYSGYVHSNKVEMRKLGTNLMENHTIFFFASFCQSIQGNDSKYSNCIREDIHSNIINNSEKLKSRCPQKGDGYYVTSQWDSVIISNDTYENCNT